MECMAETDSLQTEYMQCIIGSLRVYRCVCVCVTDGYKIMHVNH